MIAFFRSRIGPFRTRSTDRDRETDRLNIGRVTKAIDQSIANLAAEHEGLNRRLQDVTSRAAIFAGNGSDDYIEREQAASERLSVLDAEVKNAQARLDELSHGIAQLEGLREDMKARFPQLAGVEHAPRDPLHHPVRRPAAAR